MGKAMLFLVVMTVAGFAVVIWLGLGVKAPTSTSGGGFSPPTPAIPNLNLKEKAEAAGAKVAEGAKSAAQETGVLLKSVELKLGKDRLDVAAGSKAEIRVTRSGGDLAKPMQLELTPVAGSGLVASGGEFKANETGTTVTIEAPSNAHDASSVTIKGGDAVKMLPVVIK